LRSSKQAEHSPGQIEQTLAFASLEQNPSVFALAQIQQRRFRVFFSMEALRRRASKAALATSRGSVAENQKGWQSEAAIKMGGPEYPESGKYGLDVQFEPC
jgi:hypothetical protein